MRAVLHLLQNQLYIKAEKSHSSMVTFLGFILSTGTFTIDPSKMEAVKNWPAPENHKQLQRFLGFANFYRRFIKGYSSVASPLHQLTSSKTRFTWSPQAEEALQTLKNRFTSAPILTLQHPERPFIVEVEDSDSGVGAILS